MLHAVSGSSRRPGHRRTLIAIGLLLAAAVPGGQAVAGPSDPIRNDDPEQPIPPDQVENPIYYTMPVGSAEDVAGVVPEAILQQFLNAHSSMNYPAAIEAAMRLVAAVPDRPIGYYNLACALARMQRMDEAFDAFRDAIDHGWRDVVHTNIDPDLATMRSDGRFAEVMRDLQAKVQAERVTPTPLRADSWETIAADLSRDVPPLLARYHVPGAGIALINGGEVVWSAAFGERDVRDEQSLSVDDRFRLRSPLHLLAIAACARLEQDQKLRLAPLIVDAANEFGLPAAVEARGVAVGERGTAQPANIRESPSGRSQGSQRVNHDRVANVRSTLLGYSRNSVYGFLRLAIEEAADGTFPRYCEETIFPSAGVRQTTFAAPQQPAHSVVGHSALGTPLRPSVLEGEFAPGGSVYMTVGDLARLIAAGLPADGTATASHNAIFDPPEEQPGVFAGAIEMVTQADEAMAGSLGMAVKRVQTPDGVRMQMDESSSGIVLLTRWHPQTRRGVVVLCNAVTARAAAERIAHIALGGE